jgi:hypothetical protein
MNKDKNIIVTAADWIFDTLARVLVSLFDGIRNAVEHATPSLFGLVATALPYALPLPVAFMTAHSAQVFFGWDAWAAWTLGLGLEGLGLLVWVRLAEAILYSVNSANEKVENLVTYLLAVAISYEALLVFINVILAFNEGATIMYALTLLLICLLPALSAVMYGIHKRETMRVLEVRRQEEKDEAERMRQERRQDRKEAQELKLKYASEVDGDTLRFRPVKRKRKP